MFQQLSHLDKCWVGLCRTVLGQRNMEVPLEAAKTEIVQFALHGKALRRSSMNRKQDPRYRVPGDLPRTPILPYSTTLLKLPLKVT
ncbi:Hypothetical protein NTJ_14038 [Nesidiocoris tenuis]|uniref:Uncharacterized protein n=1 Tax=Nesidiocoris tenuis TaxID=355587 RepID=A0ABN7BDL6_9HEMI|nr:Hypothetical protein NTJ_14038 [Nesidiocoris tenuis]